MRAGNPIVPRSRGALPFTAQQRNIDPMPIAHEIGAPMQPPQGERDHERGAEPVAGRTAPRCV